MLYVHICFYNEEEEGVINGLKDEMTVDWERKFEFQLLVEEFALPSHRHEWIPFSISVVAGGY